MPTDLENRVREVRALSPFFDQTLSRNPGLFPSEVLESMVDAWSHEALVSACRKFLDQCLVREQGLAGSLRLLRARMMVRIIFRDLTRLTDLTGTTEELSRFADFCIREALAACHEEVEQRCGRLRNADGSPKLMTVLALGKLGGRELNLSSDVDLVFLYDGQGKSDPGNGKGVSYREFYLRVARRLIGMLDDRAETGRVFRVDMRLRPYGDSGPLVSSRPAMEQYYLDQGRDWERYAFIKARLVAGDGQLGRDFLGWMKPFIYRRYLDYGAIHSLREMKRLMERQAGLKDMGDDLKLGPGGIREIEFIVQAQQLVWGGRRPELQESKLMPVLDRLATARLLDPADAKALGEAYVFLRNSEHAIQAAHDRQTHALPTEEAGRHRLAAAMGSGSWRDYLALLDRHRRLVSALFGLLLGGGRVDRDMSEEEKKSWRSCWDKPALCSSAGLPENLEPLLISLQEDMAKTGLPALSLARVDALIPAVLMELARSDKARPGADRFFPVIRASLRRSTYLVFLEENPDALRRAIQLCELSPWVAEQLQTWPILLYELTDRSLREVSVTREALEGELRELLRIVEQGDLEGQMDTLRQFKLAATLKIAAMELMAELSVMEASDALTALAEVVLEASLEFARQHVEGRHGLPCDDDGNPLQGGFAVIGYGKAGGLELAYGSDLDLVFLCTSKIRPATDGGRSVNNNVFFNRLGQRLIHILTSFTGFGILYRVDSRLRPQGNKGPLVTTISAFGRYQQEAAWTWEKQALIRARFCAGDRGLGRAFERVRIRTLREAASNPGLLADVVAMRERMRAHNKGGKPSAGLHGQGALGTFDLKHDAGAIVDIEFMVQYAVLASAARHEGLTRWTDVMRLLDELGGAALFPARDIATLQRAYLAFRASVHYGWLGLDMDFEALHGYRLAVRDIWAGRMLPQTS